MKMETYHVRHKPSWSLFLEGFRSKECTSTNLDLDRGNPVENRTGVLPWTLGLTKWLEPALNSSFLGHGRSRTAAGEGLSPGDKTQTKSMEDTFREFYILTRKGKGVFMHS